ncbi:type II toxin-antitoxin system Phd/YefM family antitoxin [Herbiconiux moechotypicola]|uniref:Antitoxin n=1 Tax=Herbiconiux moechotypicola TaxID=637393 RepID=A0ABN3DI16_9MICO|nr:type II toxin-antitoxin system Phd/YefM family antitoxin [Herbiconiux moechotypicola]MCS5729690.1 type II toxin-antitoxin system Phd/YefM family antitoxin [Herbiconiux moechotypicola]
MTTLPVAEARANFSKIVESASTTHERFEVTRNGSRAVVILGADDYDVLLETIEILSDSSALEAIHEGLRDLEADDLVDADDLRDAMIEARRLGGDLRVSGRPPVTDDE